MAGESLKLRAELLKQLRRDARQLNERIDLITIMLEDEFRDQAREERDHAQGRKNDSR